MEEESSIISRRRLLARIIQTAGFDFNRPNFLFLAHHVANNNVDKYMNKP